MKRRSSVVAPIVDECPRPYRWYKISGTSVDFVESKVNLLNRNNVLPQLEMALWRETHAPQEVSNRRLRLGNFSLR